MQWKHLAIVAGILVAASSAMAQTPRPALVVLSKGTNELNIVDLATLKIVGKAGTGPVPHEVAVSDDGKLALSTNYGAHADGTTLSVIDLNALSEIHRVDLTNLSGPNDEKFGDLIGPHGVQFFGGEFFFTAEGSKKIARYNPQTNAVDWTYQIGQNRTHMLVVSRDGRVIYTTNVNSDTVGVLDKGEAGTSMPSSAMFSLTIIPVGKGPEGVDLSPNGKELWAANSGDGTVSVIDTATKKVVTTIDVGTKHSNRVKFTPNGKLALISDIQTGELVVVDVAARKVTKRVKLGSSAEGILVQPNGTRAFVAVSADNKVDVVDLKTLEVVGSIEGLNDPDGMAWRK
jgi:YVTN family beta-propeller protein